VSRAKRLLFAGILAGLVLGTVEIASRIYFAVRIREPVDELLRRAIYLPDEGQRAAPESPLEPVHQGRARIMRREHWAAEVVHPYVGFAVAPPDSAQGLDLETLGLGVGPFLRERPGDATLVAVFGGSVAASFVGDGGVEQVFDRIRELPELQGRRLVRLSLAQAGYKQPQSLMTLAYLLSLGAKLDAVLLLDGFNEIALPPLENLTRGVFPFFPRSWDYRVADLNLASETRALLGEAAFLVRRRSELARAVEASPLRHSRTLLLAWWLADRWISAELAQRRLDLTGERTGERLEYAATGPRWPRSDEATLYRDLISVWKESALEMRALCDAYGIRFHHFLQPNQHVPGSKPLGEEERAVAAPAGGPWAPHAERAYPLLREAGRELRQAGVRFHDLTQVFAGVEEPLYVDDCCHVNARGNALLAEAIARAILEDAAGASPSEPGSRASAGEEPDPRTAPGP
jgi:hypothetical protein